MKLRKLMTSAALAGALALPVSAPALADEPADDFFQIIQEFFNNDTRDERRGRDRDRDRDNRYHRGEQRGHEITSAEQAIDIAREHGMVRITQVELDGRYWEVEGYDQRRRWMEIEIDARTGHARDVHHRR
ncbi:PepSY domain-containing protein [Glycocaulis sp.]|uniref:PepSY domain-containing protein n=1 Tax=Glycocaulis sp. TaxID=1969725 RepID=UPI003F7143FD